LSELTTVQSTVGLYATFKESDFMSDGLTTSLQYYRRNYIFRYVCFRPTLNVLHCNH
ncbi:hypothetical protein L9F63_026834, partial [Diploptera punctata]